MEGLSLRRAAAVTGLALAGWLAVCAWPAAAARADAADRLRVEAEPAALTLGTDTTSQLEFAADAELVELRASTNTGVVESIRRTGPARFTATYRPPAKRYPQVALVAAVARRADGRTTLGWTQIRLSGQGEAEIRTRPHGKVSVKIGDREFGPTQANAQGQALVPVVVPPGIRFATHGKQMIDLGLPETSLLHVVLDREKARADRTAEIRVFALVATAEGAPREAPSVAIESRTGVVTLVPSQHPGLVEALWTIPPRDIGEAVLAARVLGEAASTASATLQLVPGPPSHVLVAIDPPVLRAGGGPLRVVATAQDGSGNPAADRLELTTSFGRIESLPSGPERREALVHVPPQLEGRTELVVRALAATGEVLARAGARLLPGAAASIQLSPAQARLTANGTATLRLAVAVADAWGNRCSDIPAIRTRSGTTIALEPGAIVYTAPKAREPLEDRVTLAVGEVTAEASIALAPPEVAFSLSARAGALRDTGARLGPFAALEPSWRLPWLGRRLALGFEAATFAVRAEGTFEEQAGARADHRFFPMAATVNWAQPLGSRWHAFAGVGGGGAFLSSQVTTGPRASFDHSAFAPIGFARLGVELKAWRGGPFLEARALRTGNVSLAGSTGAWEGWLLAIGYRSEPPAL